MNKEEDRITNMPSHLIGCILKHMSIVDAARTSILSKHWRYLWNENPHLVFDYWFSQNLCKSRHKFFETISNILSSHIGPIEKLVLYVRFVKHDDVSEVNHCMKCMLMISRSVVRKLCISYVYYPSFKLPTCILNCPKLTHLQLYNCVLEPLPLPSPAVDCLNNVKFISLQDMRVSDELMRTLLLPNMKSIRDLSIVHCKGMENLTFQLPNLSSFRFIGGWDCDWRFLESIQGSECLIIKPNYIKNFLQHRSVDVANIFDKICKTNDLSLSDSYLMALAAGGVPNSIPNLNSQLTKLCLWELRFYEIGQVSSALCILRSSPNLKCLETNVATIWNNPAKWDTIIHVLETDVTSVLENPTCMDKGKVFKKLETVKWQGLNGIKAELLFIKLLLSQSPKLRSLRIELSKKIAEEAKILEKLLQYSTASDALKITYDLKDEMYVYLGDIDTDLHMQRFSI